jgi:hypothetical protein
MISVFMATSNKSGLKTNEFKSMCFKQNENSAGLLIIWNNDIGK